MMNASKTGSDRLTDCRQRTQLHFEVLEDRLVLCTSPGCVFPLSSIPVDLGSIVQQSLTQALNAGENSYRVQGQVGGGLQVTLLEDADLLGQVELLLVDPVTNVVIASSSRTTLTPNPMPGGGGQNDSIPSASNSGLNGPGAVVGNGTIGDGSFGNTTGDYDFYSFTAAAGQIVSIDVTASSASLDSVVAVYDSAGNLIGINDNAGASTDSFFSFVTESAGTYYAVVFGSGSGLPADPNTEGTGGGAASTGPYSITIAIQEPLTVSATVDPSQELLVVVIGAGTGDFMLSVTNTDEYGTPGNQSFTVPVGGTPDDFVIADLNGDSIPDLIVADDEGQLLRVLLGNGDGTFQAPSIDVIGAGTIQFNHPVRGLVTYDFNGDGVLDVAVTNPGSSDISILFGEPDGLSYHRRFDAARNPSAIAWGDFDDDKIADLVVADNTTSGDTIVSILRGRGDGTFFPQQQITVATSGVASLSVVDRDSSGSDDIVIFGNDGKVWVLDNANGSFDAQLLADMESPISQGVVADFNLDGHLDFAGTLPDQDSVFVLWSGPNVLGPVELFFVGPEPVSIAVADIATPLSGTAPELDLGQPDGILDLVIANRGVAGSEVVVLAGQSLGGSSLTFTEPVRLLSADDPRRVAAADLNGDGVTDIVVSTAHGLRVYFGQAPVIDTNDSPMTATQLGTVTNVVLPARTIVGSQTEAWFTFIVPTEDAPGAGDQIVDLSALFENISGAGLQMEVYDSNNNLLGTGPRLRLQVAQGEQLFVRIFGLTDATGVGTGAYTLAIDVLPQVVSVEAVALLEGTNGRPAGPVTSLIVTIQGDLLDRASAQDPNNYVVTYLGPDRTFGTSDDRVIPIGGAGIMFPVIYTPNSSITTGAGQTFPSATRQTVTLNFSSALPAGSYRIEFSEDILSLEFDATEAGKLVDPGGFGGHSLASVDGAVINSGDNQDLVDLVFTQGPLDLTNFADGNLFLTQLHADLSSLLDTLLTELGDAEIITDLLIAHLQFRLGPALGKPGSRPTSVLALLLDPVSINLVDPQGKLVQYDLQTNSVVQNMPKTYVQVAGNIELIVVADAVGTYRLDIANIPTQPRGALGILNNATTQFVSLTPQIRSGITSFQFNASLDSIGGPPASPLPPNSPVRPSTPSLLVSGNPIFESQERSEEARGEQSDTAEPASSVTMESADTSLGPGTSRRDNPRLAGAGLQMLLDALPKLYDVWTGFWVQLREWWSRIFRWKGRS